MKETLFGAVMALAFLLAGTPSVAADVVATGLAAPTGMAYAGGLWVAEWGADRIVRLDARGARAEVITGISRPAGLAVDADGTLWAAAYGDGRVYAWTPERGLRAVARELASPTGLFWSARTGLLVANRDAGEIVRVHPDGRTEVVSRGHRMPVGVTGLADGSLAVSCYGGSVDLVTPKGGVTALPAAAMLVRPGVGILAVGPDGLLVVDNGGGAVTCLDNAGAAHVLARGLSSPVGLARAPDGRILVATWGDGAVRALPPAEPQ